MDYTLNKLPQSKTEITFTLNAEEWLACIKEAYNKNKHKYKLDGFRTGKVPFSAIEKRYGIEAFFEDAVDFALPKYYGEILDKETTLDVIARPDVTEVVPTAESFKAIIVVITKPDFTLGQYKGLMVSKEPTEVTDEELNAVIERTLQGRARVTEVTDRAAAMGDTVVLDFSGSVNGVKFDGGTADGYELKLGSGSFIPGFEEQLVGIKLEEDVDVKVKFPEDYQAAELAGKDAVFACVIHAIKATEVPALDDEFVKDISEFDTVAAYKADEIAKLTENKIKAARYREDDKLLDMITDGTEIDLPNELIEDELDESIEELRERMKYQGIKLEDYLGYFDSSIEKLREERRPDAIRAVKSRLVIEAIISAEKLNISGEEFDERIKQIAAEGGKDFEAFKKTITSEQFNRIGNEILSEKLFKFLRDNNTIA